MNELFYVFLNDNWEGPYEKEVLRARYAKGELASDTWVTNVDGTWQKSLSEFLVEALPVPNPLASIFEAKEKKAIEAETVRLDSQVRRFLLENGIVSQQFIGTITPEVANTLIRSYKRKKLIRRSAFILIFLGVTIGGYWGLKPYRGGIEQGVKRFTKEIMAFIDKKKAPKPVEPQKSVNATNPANDVKSANSTKPVKTIMNYSVSFSHYGAGGLKFKQDTKTFFQEGIKRQYILEEEKPLEYEYQLNPLWQVTDIQEVIDVQNREHFIKIMVRQDTVHDIANQKRKSLFIAQYDMFNRSSPLNDKLGGAFICKLKDVYFLVSNVNAFLGPSVTVKTLESWNAVNFESKMPTFISADGVEVFPEKELGIFMSKKSDIIITKLSPATLKRIYGTEQPTDECFDDLENLSDVLKVKDRVFVMGNRSGGHVMREEFGNIMALGPQIIEVDIQIRDGDGGSALYHIQTGKVLGVATGLKEGKNYFIRLDNIEDWQQLNLAHFMLQAKGLRQIHVNTFALMDFSKLKISMAVELSPFYSPFKFLVNILERKMLTIDWKGKNSQQEWSDALSVFKKDVKKEILKTEFDDIQKFLATKPYVCFMELVEIERNKRKPLRFDSIDTIDKRFIEERSNLNKK